MKALMIRSIRCYCDGNGRMIRPLQSMGPGNLYNIYVTSRLYHKPGNSKWKDIPTNEKMAWEHLGWTERLWNAQERPSNLGQWNQLSHLHQSAIQHGLNMTEKEWDSFYGSIDAIQATKDTGNSNSTAITTPSIGSKVAGTACKALWHAFKVAAPIVKELAKGRKAHPALKLAAELAVHVPGFVEEMTPPVLVKGIETIVYLDDSGSMCSHLNAGQRALEAMEKLLHNSTRIVKFGSSKTVLSARDDNWSTSLTMLGWNASSGSTYMWKMIEDDVIARYRPADKNRSEGKLRIIIITDGADTDSPAEYQGIRGMDPMMKALLTKGYDIEWHIIILDSSPGLLFGSTFSKSDRRRYESLANATGGGCLVVVDNNFQENSPETQRFLKVLKDSGSAVNGNTRQEQKKLHSSRVKTGSADNFPWVQLLPGKKSDS